MPHQTAIAEIEIATIYRELNLTEEARQLYTLAAKKFRRLQLVEEEARSRVGLARTLVNSGKTGRARAELARATELFRQKGNAAGAVSATLEGAFLEIRSGDPRAAAESVRKIKRRLGNLENPRYSLAGDLILGSSADDSAKGKLLSSVAVKAARLEYREIEVAAATALGEWHLSTGDLTAAEKSFTQAVAKIEESRGRLQADEFRMGYLAANLLPYERVVEVNLRTGNIEKSFASNERFRSRTLAEITEVGAPPDEELEAIREELNWTYRRIQSADAAASHLKKRAATLERKLVEAERKRASLGDAWDGPAVEEVEWRSVAKKLGSDTLFVEYFERDGGFSAFVLRRNSIEVVELPATPERVRHLLEELHFQFGSLRYGGKAIRTFARQLKSRADRCLEELRSLVTAPIETTNIENVVIVPAGVLNYVPFAALFDGQRYLLERYRISVAPSAAFWLRLKQKKRRNISKALLMAHADTTIPMADVEVNEIAGMFPISDVLTGDDATFEAFRLNAKGRDLVHLACHGTFRPDNPTFSSLHMADGRITVRDLLKQRLDARLVTLSACETGLSSVYAGNEVLGLVRGFLTAGAGSLVASLWNINDRLTAILMTELYTHLQRGDGAAASLRKAQLKLVAQGEHPYYWAAFFAIE
jgi:hypothetical protein